jgi:hypothetical protein
MILRHSQDHPEFGERMTMQNLKMENTKRDILHFKLSF